MVEIGREMKTSNEKRIQPLRIRGFMGITRYERKTLPSMVFIGVSLNF